MGRHPSAALSLVHSSYLGDAAGVFAGTVKKPEAAVISGAAGVTGTVGAAVTMQDAEAAEKTSAAGTEMLIATGLTVAIIADAATVAWTI